MHNKISSLICTIPLLLKVEATEFPEVIDFGLFGYFQDNLLNDKPGSWTWILADRAYELGYTAFNDSPEIGTFLTLLQKEYHLDTAVETGIFLGATTLYLSQHFDQVYAVEAFEQYHNAAKERLKSQPNIQFLLGRSEEVLKNLLPSLQDKRVLFYLDAHGYQSWPILDELEHISQTHHNNCIVVIDDFGIPGTDIHGLHMGNAELNLDHIKERLHQLFTSYSIHYLVPKERSRAAKVVIIPKTWEVKEAKSVDVLSGFSLYDFPVKLQNVADAGYTLHTRFSFPYDENNSPLNPEIKKIFVVNTEYNPEILAKIPKEKAVYFLMEPYEMPPGYYEHFSRVYTWNDDLVDNIKYFKFYYPHLFPMSDDLPSFEQKRFCTMISGSDQYNLGKIGDLYPERMKMVEFFETKPPGEFDIYGRYWIKRFYRDFRGEIPGHHSGKEKIQTLKNYKFSICFENTKDLPGYITEKIFHSFEAGCVPIYRGASNVTSYIPKNCFIDYRDFQDREQLYQFMKSMPKSVYESYLDNIRIFLSSERAQVFTPAYFEKTILEAIEGDTIRKK